MFFIILSLGIIFIAYCIDSDSTVIFFPKIIQKNENRITKVLKDLSLVLMILGISSSFIVEYLHIDLADYYRKLPFYQAYIPAYIIFRLYNINKKGTITDRVMRIENATYNLNDPELYEVYIFELKSELAISSKKLELYKSFSIMPMLLILISSFPEIVATLTQNTFMFISDFGNILLIFLTAFYFYQLISSFQMYSELTKAVFHIEKEKFKAIKRKEYKLNHPEEYK